MPKEIQPHLIQVDKSVLALKVLDYTLSDKANYKDYSDHSLEAKEFTDNVIYYLLDRLGYDERSIKRFLRAAMP